MTTVSDWLNFFDFDYEYDADKECYVFVDLQGVYLGDIDEEEYEHPVNMIERIVNSIYFDDYVLSSLQEDGYDGEDDIESLYKFVCENDMSDYLKDILYYSIHPEELAA